MNALKPIPLLEDMTVPLLRFDADFDRVFGQSKGEDAMAQRAVEHVTIPHERMQIKRGEAR